MFARRDVTRRRDAAEHDDDRCRIRSDDLEARQRAVAAWFLDCMMTSCFLEQCHVDCLCAMERKKPPVSLEDRGLIESGVSTRHDMRSRPPVPPVGDSAAIAIRMFRALVVCLDIASLQWMK